MVADTPNGPSASGLAAGIDVKATESVTASTISTMEIGGGVDVTTEENSNHMLRELEKRKCKREEMLLIYIQVSCMLTLMLVFAQSMTKFFIFSSLEFLPLFIVSLVAPCVGSGGARTRGMKTLVVCCRINIALITLFVANAVSGGQLLPLQYLDRRRWPHSNLQSAYLAHVIGFGVAESILQIFVIFCVRELLSQHLTGLLEESIGNTSASIIVLEKCGICGDDFKTGDVVKSLSCKHQFHSKCIDAWLYRSATCPMCIRGASRAVTQSSPIVAASVAMPSSSQVSIA